MPTPAQDLLLKAAEIPGLPQTAQEYLRDWASIEASPAQVEQVRNWCAYWACDQMGTRFGVITFAQALAKAALLLSPKPPNGSSPHCLRVSGTDPTES